MKNKLVIGMFGTCGNSTFRKDILIPAYKNNNIEYFNPQVEDWKPELADIEAEHLAADQIVLFPVLGETYGTGSLAETGFSIAQAMKFNSSRDFIFLIEKELTPELEKNSVAAKESIRARALVLAHFKQIDLPNAYIVDTIDEMLELSIVLYRAQEAVWSYREKYALNAK